MKTRHTSPYTIVCYDRRTGPKMAVLLLAALAGLLLGLLLLRPVPLAEALAPVQQLPRVEISGKSQAARASERAAQAGAVEQLPRVLIEGRSLQGQHLAQAGPGG